MRAVVTRVKSASVRVGGEVVGSIGAGLLVLLGVASTDEGRDAAYMAQKVVGLRIFSRADRMVDSVVDVGGAVLVVSQFTLYGDCRKGRRPNFSQAADPERARELYRAFIGHVEQLGVPVAEGRFGAMMDVESVNDGPVTLILESPGST